MPLPDDFPIWAKALAYAVVAIGIGVTFVLGRMARQQGRSASPQASPAAAQVAAVIVDPTALNRASAAVEGLAAGVLQLVVIGRSIARANAAAAASNKEMVKATADLCETVDKLRDEIIRAAAKIE